MLDSVQRKACTSRRIGQLHRGSMIVRLQRLQGGLCLQILDDVCPQLLVLRLAFGVELD